MSSKETGRRGTERYTKGLLCGGNMLSILDNNKPLTLEKILEKLNKLEELSNTNLGLTEVQKAKKNIIEILNNLYELKSISEDVFRNACDSLSEALEDPL